MLSVTHLCCVSLTYAECHSLMLSVANEIIMLCVAMLCVAMLSVVLLSVILMSVVLLRVVASPQTP